jgi:hypothetical protein
MKRSASDMYEGGKTADDEGVDGAGNESSMSGLLMANKLLYHFPHDFSVVTNATKKESLFAQRQYQDGETMMCTVMTGSDFVDPLRSYISFDVDARLTGPGYWWEHSHTGFGANNTACNFIKSIVVKSRSGDELMRTNNFNVLAAHKQLYCYDKGWWDTVGSQLTQVQQTSVTDYQLKKSGRQTDYSNLLTKINDNGTLTVDERQVLIDRTKEKTWVTGKHRVNIPLYCLGGIFATDKLLPQNLCAGMIVSITLADARDVYVWHSQNDRQGNNFDAVSDDTAGSLRLSTATNDSETEISGDEFKTFAGNTPTQFTVSLESVINDPAGTQATVFSLLDAGFADTTYQASKGDAIVLRDATGAVQRCARITDVNGLEFKDGSGVDRIKHTYQIAPINTLGAFFFPRGNTQLTNLSLYFVDWNAFVSNNLAAAIDITGNLRPQTGAIDPTPEEERQMRFAKTRQDLIRQKAWGFDSSGNPYTFPSLVSDGDCDTTTNVFSNTSFKAGYTVTVPRLILHCNQLTDATQRAVNATSAHNGLEIVYYDYENTQAPDTALEAHIEVKKAVSRAMKAIAVIRPKATSDTNASTCLKAHTNTMACLPFNVKEYQWQLGSLYYPHQRIEGKNAGHDGIPFTSGMAYNETLDCFSGFAPKRTYSNVSFREFQGLTVGTKSHEGDGRADEDTFGPFRNVPSISNLYGQNRKVQWQDPTYRGNGVIAQTLERSGIFELSGLPINNSRVLSLHMTLDPSDIQDPEADKCHVDIFLKYVKVARVFMQMVEVES